MNAEFTHDAVQCDVARQDCASVHQVTALTVAFDLAEIPPEQRLRYAEQVSGRCMTLPVCLTAGETDAVIASLIERRAQASERGPAQTLRRPSERKG